MMPDTLKALLRHAFQSDDIAALDSLIDEHPALLNAPNRCQVLKWVRSVAMAEWLLNHGMELQAISEWWGPGFGTREVHSDVGRFLVERGAALTPHAAAGLGLIDPLTAMLAADPTIVDAKGGDGCTPLHFSRNVATASLLLEHGARIDARDEDHDSTPAQWLIGDAPEVTRFLVERGAATDLFMAAALGDRALAEQHIESDPSCLRQRIGRLPEFPPLGHKGGGGTIYQWTLAFNSYAHQIALRKGHPELFEFLYEASDTTTRLLVDCVLARRKEAETIAAENPGLVAGLPDADQELVARYCWETNTDYEAVKLMLDIGFPVAHPERSHGYTPLHNAAWSGSADLVELLLSRGHPVDIVDPAYDATPLGFAIHDCVVEKRHPQGEFGKVAELLLDAGSPWEALHYPVGDARIDDVLKPRLLGRVDGAALLGDRAAVARLLGEHPAAEQLTQALAGAAMGGHVEMCREFLSAGAPVNGPSGRDRLTPLMCAAASGSEPIVAMLLEGGAEVTAKNKNGSVALHMAISGGAELDVIRLLLSREAKAQLEATNRFGYTPLRLAQENGRDDIVKLLDDSK